MSKITVSFDCDGADTASYLLLVYEILEQTYEATYTPSYHMERLPDFLGLLNDVLAEHITDNGEWIRDRQSPGYLFAFSKEDFKRIKNLLGWP